MAGATPLRSSLHQNLSDCAAASRPRPRPVMAAISPWGTDMALRRLRLPACQPNAPDPGDPSLTPLAGPGWQALLS